MIKALYVIIAAALLGCGPIITSTSYRFEEKGVMDSTAAANNPEKVLKLHIENYKDSIFPNDFISSYINVESIYIDSRSLAYMDKFNQTVRIDTVKLRKLKALHTLTFFNVQFSDFPTGLHVVDSLKKLTLYQAALKSLPSDLSGFSNLQELDLSANELAKLPEDLKLPRNLKQLVLKNNRLRVIPAQSFEGSTIKELYLNNVPGRRKHAMNQILITSSKLNFILQHSSIEKLYLNAVSRNEQRRIYDLVIRKSDRKRLFVTY